MKTTAGFDERFEKGGTFGSMLMASDAMPKRFDNSAHKGFVYTGGTAEREELLFQSMAYALTGGKRRLSVVEGEEIELAIEKLKEEML